jgi:hypothetical protein
MAIFTHLFTFVLGGALAAFVIRANPKKSIIWLTIVAEKAKAARAKW